MTLHHPLARRIAAFIQNPPTDADETFNELALALYAHQYSKSPWVRRLADAAHRAPTHVHRWQDVPAMPAAAFKDLPLSCTPPGRAAAVFHSSGTTGAQTSRHYMSRDALALYETSLRAGFAQAVPRRPPLLWALMPAPADAPHSSLSYMLGALGASQFWWDNNPALSDALTKLDAPVTLFGTAFALLGLLESTGREWALPPGSIVVETGGFKGHTQSISREDFYAALAGRLSIPIPSITSEYGMSEMASQFYSHGEQTTKQGPHWVRTEAIDPATGLPAPANQPGALRHYDLANFNSAACLQTSDWGTLTPTGFVLHGRAPGADLRGCSLSAEDLWTRSQTTRDA